MGIADECTHPAMIGLDGIICEGSACMYSLMGFQPIIEAVDIGEGDFIKCKDASEHFEDVAEKEILTLGGG